jgi:hypothetical protein
MSRRHIATALTFGSLLFASTAAFAQEAPAAAAKPHFGDQGQFALSINHDFMVNQSDMYAGPTFVQGSYFVAPNLSLGLSLGAEWLQSSPPQGSSQSNFIFRAGPRVGYNVQISDNVSLWPQVGIDFRHADTSSSSTSVSGGVVVTSSDTTSDNALGLAITSPLLIHPTQGFFLGAGPTFYADLFNKASSHGQNADNNKIIGLGLTAVIGGSF